MSLPAWRQAPALQAVAALVSAGLPPHSGTPPGPVAASAPDWIAVVTLALQHNVAGLLHRGLGSAGLPGVPAALAQAVSRHATEIGHRNGAALAELHRLLLALAAAGVPAIPLKGAWLCQRLYGDLTARPGRDIDILIPETDLPAALPVFEACGYPTTTGLTPRQQRAQRRYSGQLVTQRRDGAFVVEPHWALAPHTISLGLDYPGLWRRVQTVAAGGAMLPTLAAEDEFVMLCQHGFKEEWQRLKWLADLAAFVITHPQLDYDVITTRARQQGAWWIVLVGAQLIAAVMGIETPVAAMARREARPMASVQEVLRRMADASLTREMLAPAANIYHVSRLRLAMRERASDRVRYILRTVLTPRDLHFRALALPDRLHGAYVPAKLAHDYILLPGWLLTRRLQAKLPPHSTGGHSAV